MTDAPRKRPPTDREKDLAEAASKFVDETGYGLAYDDAEGEGEPFDFGIDDDADRDAA